MTTEFDYGDQSPEAVRRAAGIAAEAIRYLNHAALFRDRGALKYPADVDAVLVELESMAARLPQLLGQISGWLVAEAAAGRLWVISGAYAGNGTAAVSAAGRYLGEADVHAGALRDVLHDARQITAAIAPAGSEEES